MELSWAANRTGIVEIFHNSLDIFMIVIFD